MKFYLIKLIYNLLSYRTFLHYTKSIVAEYYLLNLNRLWK